MSIKISDLKTDCRHFRGDIPCRPSKEHGVHCVDEAGADCPYYEKTTGRILIIKLGALGDVIRTTPLLRRLKAENPWAEIWWITHAPEVVPKSVDVILSYTAQSVAVVTATPFDVVYSLDKDRDACALCALVQAPTKRGFTLRNGKCVPIDASAHHKYLTGLFDDISKANTKSYQEEIFDVCGYTFAGERYMMPELEEYTWKLPKKKIIVGLNTGCGGRWTSRLWPDASWVTLARKLKKAGCVPLLLGGEQEHAKNLRLARQSGALYLGHFPMRQFMSEVRRCDLVVTAVTMAMHLAIGFERKIVLFNNIFNKHEFELYGNGVVLEPEIACDCFYSPTCPKNCMKSLKPETVFASCKKLLAL
jgi:heptosyltransferase-2